MADERLSYCQIIVGQALVGLVGLVEIFESLANESIEPDAPGLGKWLVSQVRQHNYVPRGAVAAYETALLREYRAFLEARRSGTSEHAWRDPRKEHKPWYPTIFAEKCNGCGECVPVCPNHVLGWDLAHCKVLVLEPYECAVGCELCAKACPTGAISMPPRAMLHQRTDASGSR